MNDLDIIFTESPDDVLNGLFDVDDVAWCASIRRAVSLRPALLKDWVRYWRRTKCHLNAAQREGLKPLGLKFKGDRIV